MTTKGISVGDETSVGDWVSVGDSVSVGVGVPEDSGVSVGGGVTLGGEALVAPVGSIGDGENLASEPLHAADITRIAIIKHIRPGRYFFNLLTLLED